MSLHALLLGGGIASLSIAGLVAASLLFRAYRWIAKVPVEPTLGPGNVEKYEIRAASELWIHRMLVAFDIALNVIVLKGQQDETMSTHMWRASLEGKTWGKVMCWWLNGFQQNHGFKAACGDVQRAKSRVVQLSKLLGIQV